MDEAIKIMNEALDALEDAMRESDAGKQTQHVINGYNALRKAIAEHCTIVSRYRVKLKNLEKRAFALIDELYKIDNTNKE